MLPATPPPLSQQEIENHLADLMPAWDLQDIRNLAYLSGGYSNVNYAFDYQQQRYVLRVPQVEQPFVDREHERQWYDRLPEGVGIRPLALSTTKGTMLTPWIAGQLLADVYPRFPLSTLTGYLHDLHHCLPDAHRTYDLEKINAEYWINDTPPTVVRNPPPELLISCHNDLNPWNVIVTRDGWVTLDWEFVGGNDPLFDLVSLHQGLALTHETLRPFALAYLGTEPESFEQRLHSVQMAYWSRELGWAHFQIEQGNQRAEIYEQLRSSEAALESLMRGL